MTLYEAVSEYLEAEEALQRARAQLVPQSEPLDSAQDPDDAVRERAQTTWTAAACQMRKAEGDLREAIKRQIGREQSERRLSDVEDLTQEVMIKLIRSRHELRLDHSGRQRTSKRRKRPDGSPTARRAQNPAAALTDWLNRVIATTGMDAGRRDKKRERDVSIFEGADGKLFVDPADPRPTMEESRIEQEERAEEDARMQRHRTEIGTVLDKAHAEIRKTKLEQPDDKRWLFEQRSIHKRRYNEIRSIARQGSRYSSQGISDGDMYQDRRRYWNALARVLKEAREALAKEAQTTFSPTELAILSKLLDKTRKDKTEGLSEPVILARQYTEREDS